MEKFKTLDEAQAAYDKLTKNVKDLEKSVADKDAQIADLTKKASDAETAAQDAIDKINNGVNTDTVDVTVDKRKYRINFGVDGKSKEDLKCDNKLLKKLIEKGSAAITLIS